MKYRLGNFAFGQLDIPANAVITHDIENRGFLDEKNQYVVNTDFSQILSFDGLLYLKALKGATITHEEHGTISLPPGSYCLIRQYRQGDFLFVESRKEISTEAQPEKRIGKRLIVGLGEATGHHHAIAEKDAEIVATPEIRWLKAPSGANVVHEEHRTIELPSGTYRIVQQRVYHAGKVQRVVD